MWYTKGVSTVFSLYREKASRNNCVNYFNKFSIPEINQDFNRKACHIYWSPFENRLESHRILLTRGTCYIHRYPIPAEPTKSCVSTLSQTSIGPKPLPYQATIFTAIAIIICKELVVPNWMFFSCSQTSPAPASISLFVVFLRICLYYRCPVISSAIFYHFIHSVPFQKVAILI